MCAVCVWSATPITIAPRTWLACRTSVSIHVDRVLVRRMPSARHCSIAPSAVAPSNCHWVIPSPSARHAPWSLCAVTMVIAPANWPASMPSARTHVQNSLLAHAVPTAVCWTVFPSVPWSVSVPSHRCPMPVASVVSWCCRARRDARVIWTVVTRRRV